MAERVAYHLIARSPFHIGERGVGLEETSAVLHADTLFSALCLTLRELGEDLDALLTRFPRVRMPADGTPETVPGEGELPFRLTSAFPFAGPVYFFPRPMLRPVGLDDADPVLGKTLKKISFVSQDIFGALVAGRSVADALLVEAPVGGAKRKMRSDLVIQDGQAWVTPAERTDLLPYLDAVTGDVRLWEQGTAPRVTVDRVTNRSQVYAAGRLSFAPGCGLFFLVDYEDVGLRSRVEQALRVLGDTGIGGERSSGHGQFELEIVERFQLGEPSSEASDAFTTLATYWPTEPEVMAGILDDASYGLVNRRGWLASPEGMNLRRRGVRMLTEGSVTLRAPAGALAEVKPLDPAPAVNVSHDVWRYGIAFPVRCLAAISKEATHEP
jgi:CRISPR-associated protein Csm4